MNSALYLILHHPQSASPSGLRRLLLVKFGKRFDESLVDELDASDSCGVPTILGVADTRSDVSPEFLSLLFEPFPVPCCRGGLARIKRGPTASLSPFTPLAFATLLWACTFELD